MIKLSTTVSSIQVCEDLSDLSDNAWLSIRIGETNSPCSTKSINFNNLDQLCFNITQTYPSGEAADGHIKVKIALCSYSLDKIVFAVARGEMDVPIDQNEVTLDLYDSLESIRLIAKVSIRITTNKSLKKNTHECLNAYVF